ncbi:hypothetical protein J6590_108548 [Homalodisca vitripennis]|nr:hypothetical protein J6590_108548 [Homalodisca vitripennis]
MSVVSSAINDKNLVVFISCFMLSWQTASMQSSNSFWILLDVPLNTVALSRCSFNEASNSAEKFTSPLKTPGFEESSCSRWPLSANSNAPQKLIQSISLEST